MTPYSASDSVKFFFSASSNLCVSLQIFASFRAAQQSSVLISSGRKKIPPQEMQQSTSEDLSVEKEQNFAAPIASELKVPCLTVALGGDDQQQQGGAKTTSSSVATISNICYSKWWRGASYIFRALDDYT
jgi:hypothetical protein